MVLTLECTSGSEVLTVVDGRQLNCSLLEVPEQYKNWVGRGHGLPARCQGMALPYNGCFQALVVVFGQEAVPKLILIRMIRRHFVDGERIALISAEVESAMKRILLSLIAIAATVAVPILAQEQQPGQYDQQDPQMEQQDQQQSPDQQEPDGQYEQGRGVARISVINGDVSMRRGDSGDVVAAAAECAADGERHHPDRVILAR